MIENDLFDLLVPRVALVSDDASSGSISLGLGRTLIWRDDVVLLLCLQVLLNHDRVHLDRPLVDDGRVFLAELQAVQLLQAGQLLEDARPVVRLRRGGVALEAELLEAGAVLHNMVKLV